MKSTEARFFSPEQVFVGTLIGTPAIGGVQIFLNRRNVGEKGAAVVFLSGAILFAFAALITPIFLDSPLGSASFTIGISIGFFQLTSSFLEKIKSPDEGEPQYRSWWIVFGFSVLGASISIAFVQLVMILPSQIYN